MVPEIERLEKIRKELGYSREEVCGVTEISLNSYSNWVHKGHEPNYKNMRKINEGTRKLIKRLREKESEEKLQDFFKQINKLAAAPLGILEESMKDKVKDQVEVADYGKRGEKR